MNVSLSRQSLLIIPSNPARLEIYAGGSRLVSGRSHLRGPGSAQRTAGGDEAVSSRGQMTVAVQSQCAPLAT